jgi:uncharacterized protein
MSMGRLMKASVLTLFFAAALSGCGCHPHTVQLSGAGMEGLRVSGQGMARGTPDVARATLGVEVRAATSEEATKQVGDRMQAVLAALKAQGVADRDMRTEQISIFFEQEPRPPEPWPAPAPAPAPGKVQPEKAPEPPKPELPRGFYRASNTVEITIRNLDHASDILGAATSAGANSMYGMRFELENDDKVQAEAREKAVKDARAHAEELARLSGVKLGPIVMINENPGFAGPVPMMMKAEMGRSADASMPVERGELTVTTQVEIVYSLEK